MRSCHQLINSGFHIHARPVILLKMGFRVFVPATQNYDDLLFNNDGGKKLLFGQMFQYILIS